MGSEDRIGEKSGRLTMYGIGGEETCILGQMTMLAAVGADEVSSVFQLLAPPSKQNPHPRLHPR